MLFTPPDRGLQDRKAKTHFYYGWHPLVSSTDERHDKKKDRLAPVVTLVTLDDANGKTHIGASVVSDSDMPWRRYGACKARTLAEYQFACQAEEYDGERPPSREPPENKEPKHFRMTIPTEQVGILLDHVKKSSTPRATTAALFSRPTVAELYTER